MSGPPPALPDADQLLVLCDGRHKDPTTDRSAGMLALRPVAQVVGDEGLQQSPPLPAESEAVGEAEPVATFGREWVQSLISPLVRSDGDDDAGIRATTSDRDEWSSPRRPNAPLTP